MLAFHGKELLHPGSTRKLETTPHRLSATDFFNIFAARVHVWRPSPLSETWRRAMPWLYALHLPRTTHNKQNL